MGRRSAIRGEVGVVSVSHRGKLFRLRFDPLAHKGVHLQLENVIVVVEGITDVRRRGGRERWNWQSDSSLAILLPRANQEPTLGSSGHISGTPTTKPIETSSNRTSGSPRSISPSGLARSQVRWDRI